MSLQIWLPLNGNTDNFGLDSAKPSGNIVYDANGKIGKCGRMDSQLSLIPTSQIYTDNMSVSFWMRSTASSPSWHIIIALDNISLSQMHGIYIAETGRIKYEYNPSINLYSTISEWHHYTYVLSNGKSYGYVDGKLKTTSTETMTHDLIGRIKIGAATNSMFLNDVRIYDHALSAKEVKELAKGLVLHYRLTGSGQENLVQDGLTEITCRSQAQDYPLKVISNLKDNTQYTLSFDAKSENGLGTFYCSLANNGSSQIYFKTQIKPTTTFTHYEYTVTRSTQTTNRVLFAAYYGWSNNANVTDTIHIKNVKLEEGSIATPWCPNPADPLYSILGYNNNIEYDCAGYQRNGTKRGTIAWDVDSPRYTTSYKFNSSTNSTITIPTLSCITNNGYQTLSCWFKTSGLGAGMMLNGLICLGYGDSLFLDGSGCVYFRIDNGRDLNAVGTTESYSDSKWHLATVTYDGASVKIYVDGKLKNTFSRVMANRYVSSGSFSIGTEANNPPVYMYNGNISDVRIYATALSAEDIAELYHSAVIVDNTSKSYAYEYFEAQ